MGRRLTNWWSRKDWYSGWVCNCWWCSNLSMRQSAPWQSDALGRVLKRWQSGLSLTNSPIWDQVLLNVRANRFCVQNMGGVFFGHGCSYVFFVCFSFHRSCCDESLLRLLRQPLRQSFCTVSTVHPCAQPGNHFLFFFCLKQIVSIWFPVSPTAYKGSKKWPPGVAWTMLWPPNSTRYSDRKERPRYDKDIGWQR